MDIITPNRTSSSIHALDSSLSNLSLSLSRSMEDLERKLLQTANTYYSEERYRESADILKRVCKEFPHNKPAKGELSRTISRLLEQQRGFYNWRLMHVEVQQLTPPSLDHASYTGPVEARESVGKDRGLFTTLAIKAGDLLLCEKAFSYFYSHENRSTPSGLMEATIRKLSRNPELMPSLISVYHGTYTPTFEVGGKLIVDPYLVERVMTLNSFGGSDTSLSSHLSDSNKGHSSGIWIQAAIINHSCIGNCRRSFIGDMLIIRATQNLPANTELLWPYRNPPANDPDYAATQVELQEYGFVCGCDLCLDAKSTGKKSLKKRDSLRSELSASFATGSTTRGFDFRKVDTERIERSLAALEATYRKSCLEVPRTGLWDPYLALTRIYALLGRAERVVWGTLKVLDMLGFSVKQTKSGMEVEKWGLPVEYLVECWLLLWTSYVFLGEKTNAAGAKELALVAYRIIVGEDSTFEESYGSRAKDFVKQKKIWTNS